MAKAKIKKNIFLGLGLFFLTAAGIGGTYAYYSHSITVENRIQLGDIDVSLVEYRIDSEGKERLYEDNLLVQPGDTISKIPRITCQAQPCYIRALITHGTAASQSEFSSLSQSIPENNMHTSSDTNITTDSGSSHQTDSTDDHAADNHANNNQTAISAIEYAESLSDENIFGFSDNWTKIGNYYYYLQILTPGESVDLFQGIIIPSEWGTEHAKQELALSIQIDAIQADNFVPDFSSMQPWGHEEIEICAHSGDRSTFVNPYTTMYVEFEGNSHKLIAVPQDFFTNIGTAMPGDILSDTVTLKNTTKDDVELFFHTALPDSLTEEQNSLLEQIALTISLDGKELYCGNLEAASLHSDISLGSYPSQHTGNFDFTLTIPDALKNRYALTDAIVKWVFSVRQDGFASPVRTSDTMMYLPFLFLGIGGIILLCIYLILRIYTPSKYISGPPRQNGGVYILPHTKYLSKKYKRSD